MNSSNNKNILTVDNVESSTNNNNKIETQTIYYDFSKKFLTFGTHNVQDFNVETKQRVFFDEYEYNDIDIIGLTETKLTEKKGKNTLKNKKNYRSW